MIESVKRTVEIMQYIAQNGNQVRLKDRNAAYTI